MSRSWENISQYPDYLSRHSLECKVCISLKSSNIFQQSVLVVTESFFFLHLSLCFSASASVYCSLTHKDTDRTTEIRWLKLFQVFHNAHCCLRLIMLTEGQSKTQWMEAWQGKHMFAQMLLFFHDIMLKKKLEGVKFLLHTFIVLALNLNTNMPTLTSSEKTLHSWVHSIMSMQYHVFGT